MRGRIQREGVVVHLVAHAMTDLSQDLASVGRRDAAAGGPGAETAGAPPARPATKVRDIYIPDLTLDTIRVKTQDFRRSLQVLVGFFSRRCDAMLPDGPALN